MRTNTTPFDALARSGVVQDWIEAFRAAMRVRLLLVPGKPDTTSSFPPKSCLRAPILIAGKHVATLMSQPVAVAAVFDRRPQTQRSAKAICGHRPPLQLSKHQLQGCQRLLNLIAQHLSEFVARSVTAISKQDPPCVARAKEFIHAHIADNISLSDVAKRAHYSPERFRKRFRKFVGMPLGEYLSRARVEKARELMADPHQRATEVAFVSGFQSIPSFNRVFKRHTGLSPTQYRASLKAGPKVAKSEKETTADE